MSTKDAPDGRIRFGAFEADLQSQELLKEGKRIPLANQCFVVLAALLERPGQLVSREELRRRLWPDNRVVEFEQGLHAIINRLRDALGDGPAGAGMIETLPRRGYRFIGTLQTNQAVKTPRGRAIGVAIALCVVSVGLVAWVTAVWLGWARPQQASNHELKPLTSLVGSEVGPAISPAGDRLLFAWNGAADAGGGVDLYSKVLDSERLVRLTHDAALAMHPAWAPGGEQVALARQGERESGVFLITPEGGPERLLASANFISVPFLQLSWSPDKRQIAYAAVESDGWSHIAVVDCNELG